MVSVVSIGRIGARSAWVHGELKARAWAQTREAAAYLGTEGHRAEKLGSMADGTPGRFYRVKSWTQKRPLITHFSLVEVFKICCPTWHFPKVPHRLGMLLPVHGQTESFSQHTPKGPSPRSGPRSP